MKKIFILTGEPSGDKLASEVIKNIKNSRSDIDYLCVGGKHLNSIGVESIYDQKDVTYIAFTDILFNLSISSLNFSSPKVIRYIEYIRNKTNITFGRIGLMLLKI